VPTAAGPASAIPSGPGKDLTLVAAVVNRPVRFGSPSRATYGSQMTDIPGFKIVGFAGAPLPS